jgi:hypothetical protein
MKTRLSSPTVIACLIALLAVSAAALLKQSAAAAEDGPRFEFGSEIEHPFGDKAVKGAPFSAQVSLETSQTLANGVHVAQKRTGGLYRDSEGRTRQEFLRDGTTENVQINDRVGGVLYNLNMFRHTFGKVNIGTLAVNRELEERKREREHAEREHSEREQMERTKAIGVAVAEKKIEPSRRVESLGVQNYEGVAAEVTRFTITIPAGMQGNDKPFDIVSERWYSPDLNLLVMAKRSDPRTGETVYRLSNINRGEPAASLFEPPSDFNVSEEKTEYRRNEK